MDFVGLGLGKNIPDFYEILTAPATKVCYKEQKAHKSLFFC